MYRCECTYKCELQVMYILKYINICTTSVGSGYQPLSYT